MLVRTSLVQVSGIPSTYFAPKTKTRLDVSELPAICHLTADTKMGLVVLRSHVRMQGGAGADLYVSDLYRSWAMQAKAYNDWTAGKRKDYAAPPGASFHMAGRAIDIDLKSLKMPLSDFWTLSAELGWRPIISDPDATKSEAWHFQHLGQDWTHLVGKLADGEIAKCAILDAGQWKQDDPDLPVLFLQAQCNRLSNRPGSPPVLRVDGALGPKTKAFVTDFLGPSWTLQSANQRLITL